MSVRRFIKSRPKLWLICNGFGEALDQNPAHRHVNKRLAGLWKPFVIFGKTTVPAKPSESSLNNPSTWQNMKSGGYHGRFLARSDPDLMNTGPPMLYDFDRPAEVFPGPGFQPFRRAEILGQGKPRLDD